MNSWTGDVDDPEDDEEEQTDDEPGFPKKLEKAVRGPGSPTDLGELEYVNGLEEVDDEDLLREAWLALDGEKQNLVENRLSELGVEVSEGNGGESNRGESESSDGSSDDSGWGGSDDEESSESVEESEPDVESFEEMDDENPSEDSQSESDGSQPAQNGPPEPPNAVSPGEAATRDRRWKILVWGPPKLFKTHFCYTMPEPIAYIDTEGKADDIAQKFTDKNVQIWQPKNMSADPDTKFRRTKKALDEALEWLEWYRDNEGVIGTIVVDSVTLTWEWAQVHHKLENYPIKSEEEGVESIELSANFNSSQESDWAAIKEYHNGEFRERITDSEFHFCWTAMERQDIQRAIDEETNIQLYEPKGEPDNDYKADTVIRARKDSDRGKVGDLVGSNFTDNVFVGLKKPTFPKTRDAIEAIANAEASSDPTDRSELASDIGAETIIDYDPQMYGEQ